MSIDTSAWCFDFALTEPGVVRALADFLSSHADRAEFAELILGSFGGAAVWVVNDDEFQDRLFLRAAGGGSLVEFTLTGEAVLEFTAAVAEAAVEFEADV